MNNRERKLVIYELRGMLMRPPMSTVQKDRGADRMRHVIRSTVERRIEHIQQEIAKHKEDISMPIKVQFKRTKRESILPRRSTTHAACYDVFAAENATLFANSQPTAVPLGFSAAIPNGWRIDIHGRSGNALKGLRIHHGIIDSDYRGEVCAILSLDFGDVPWIVRPGDRIAQISINQVHEVQVEEVEDLPPADSNRVGGFGSTGT